MLALVPAARANVTLTDQNSSMSIDPDTQAGAYSWIVDGQNQLYQQWFWYRVGTTGGQASIDTISAPVINQLAADRVDISYGNNQLMVEVTYDLTGGSVGSGTSDVAEVIRITNVSGNRLSFSFFQYSDFDLDGNSIDDTATIHTILGKGYVASQVGAGKSAMTETVVTPGAARWEANLYANTLSGLNGGNYNLNNSLSAGPGDATWAFQWDFTLDPNRTFLISKDKQITAVPEPSTLAIAGLAGLGLAAAFRRRRGS